MSKHILLASIVFTIAGCSSVSVSEGPLSIKTSEDCAQLLSDYDRRIGETAKDSDAARLVAERDPTQANYEKSRKAAADAGAATADRAAIEGACKAGGL